MYNKLLPILLAATVGLGSGLAMADQLDDIQAKGELVVGTLGVDEPNSFIDPKSRQLVGYEIDLSNEVAQALGVKASFKQISVAARIPELRQNRVDMLAASLTHTRERGEQVDFSYTILVTGQVVLVKKDSGIRQVSDLNGKKVLTVKGGTQEPNIKKAAPDANVVTFETTQQAFLALQQGKGDAFVDDESALLDDYAKLGDKKDDYLILPEKISIEPLALAVRKDEPRLKQAVNDALAKLEASGEAERLYLKWYGPGTRSDIPERTFKIDSDQIDD